jgi:pimeloyl-ACP methyl ester carboxylesterase
LSLHVIYLHGFASSPESSKAVRIADALRSVGATTVIPDLNLPEFRTLTVTRMIEQVEALIDAAEPGPVVLIGSSLGAFVAVHTAARDSRVKGVILLAPALDFGADENDRIGAVSIADWRASGSCEVFHYARNRVETLDFALYEDAERYDAFGVDLPVPVLIFQGTSDTVVNPDVVRRWAAGRSNVKLVLVSDGHQLQGALDTICDQIVPFMTSLDR